jgi:hypothetical protein
MKQWVNADRTVLVRFWPKDDAGQTMPEAMEVATRMDSDAVWGPPIRVEVEK